MLSVPEKQHAIETVHEQLKSYFIKLAEQQSKTFGDGFIFECPKQNVRIVVLFTNDMKSYDKILSNEMCRNI